MRTVKLFVFLAVVVAVALGGLYAYQRYQDSQDPYADPESVELPPLPNDQATTQTYLSTSAAGAIDGLMRATELVLDEGSTPDECAEAVAILDGVGTPDTVFAVVSGVPDPATAEMAVSQASALSLFLGHCLQDGQLPDTDRLRFTSIVLQRRLEEFG